MAARRAMSEMHATFDGAHDWFWRNGAGGDALVTLSTEVRPLFGDKRIL